MNQGGSGGDGAAVALFAVFAGALGLAWWCLGVLLAGPSAVVLFGLGSVASVAFLMVLEPRHPRVVALPMGIVPLFSAPWTAPTGDNDGLWVAVFPLLLVWVFVLLGVAFGVRQLLQRRPERPAAQSRRRGVLGAEGMVVALAVVGALWLHTNVVAGPWSDLRSQLSTFPVPAGFTTVDWAREGSSRCTDSGCVAQIRHTVQANVPAAAACPALEESLRTWPGTSAVTTDVPIGDWEKCAYFMSQRSDGTTREVEATVEAPPGRPAEIIVRMLADCVLTCPNQDSYGSDTS